MATSFRLARLLRLRTQLRTLKEGEVEQMLGRLDRLVGEAETVAAARERRSEAERLAAAEGGLSVDVLQLGRDYDRALAAREQRCREEVGRTQDALAARRDELLHQHREERKVRRLEETFRQRASESADREAARTLDELVIDRHERSRKKGGDGHG
jgi:flagellar export protein FliJ